MSTHTQILASSPQVLFWNFEISDEANRQRLIDAREQRRRHGLITSYTSLNMEQRAALHHLDEKCRELVIWIEEERLRIIKDRSSSDCFPDGTFELDTLQAIVDFPLSESAPDFDPQDDCYLYRHHQIMSLECPATSDPFVPCHFSASELAGLMATSAIFHDLVDASGLDLLDILRIDEMFCDLVYEGIHRGASLLDATDHTTYAAVTHLTWNSALNNEERLKLHLLDDARQLDVGKSRFDKQTSAKAHCLRINTYLRSLERIIFATELALTKHLNFRVADTKDALDDYELDVYVDSFLRDDDAVALKTGNRWLIRQEGHCSLHKRADEQSIQEAINFLIMIGRILPIG